jgi:DHA1 family tetracycline resistance protein-like MFS transporter
MSAERGRSLGPVLLTVMLDLLGFGIVIPLMSFYAEAFAATPLQVALLMSVYSVAQFLAAPVWGGLSDRVGRRPVMLASIAGGTLALAGFASATNLTTLFIFRALHGVFAANISAAQAYVADITGPEDRARGMGLIGASFGLGFSLGPAIGGELSAWGLSTPIWFAAALSAINLVWAYFGLPESVPLAGARARTQRTIDPRAMLATLSHPVVGRPILLAFLSTFGFAMMESTFGLVAEHRWGMTAQGVGRQFFLIGVVGILIQGGAIGRLVKRFGEIGLLRVGYPLQVAALVLLVALSDSLAISLTCGLLALGSSMCTPSVNALVSRGAHADEQGAVLGVNQSMGALARATAPAIGGALYQGWFDAGAFVVSACILSIAAMVAWTLSPAPAVETRAA